PPVASEIALYPFCYSDPDPALATIICGRCFMDPIMKNRGFIPCTDDCSLPPVPPNLCFTVPPGFTNPVVTPLLGTGAACTLGTQCVSGTCTGGTCQACKAPGFNCVANGACCSLDCAPFGAPNGSQSPACN